MLKTTEVAGLIEQLLERVEGKWPIHDVYFFEIVDV
jgi:hypothetical protein